MFQDSLRGLRLKKPKPAPQPCWTFEEVQRILAASPKMIHGPLTLLRDWMRFGELAWLTWNDVDAAALRIRPKKAGSRSPETSGRSLSARSPLPAGRQSPARSLGVRDAADRAAVSAGQQ